MWFGSLSALLATAPSRGRWTARSTRAPVLSSCLPGNMRVVSVDEFPSVFLKWDNDFRPVTFNSNFETYERLAKDDSASGAGGFIVAVQRGQHFSAA